MKTWMGKGGFGGRGVWWKGDIMDVVVAWLKTALVEAHHMKEVKEAAVKILQVVGIPAHPLKGKLRNWLPIAENRLFPIVHRRIEEGEKIHGKKPKDRKLLFGKVFIQSNHFYGKYRENPVKVCLDRHQRA
jgi:hypothetical protein